MSPQTRNIILWLLAAALLLGTGVGVQRYRRTESPQPSPVPTSAREAATQLLTLSLPDATGQAQTLSHWRGRPVLINFWASWCGPCREEMPLLDRASREQPENGVQVIGIAWDRADNVTEYLRDHPTHYPILIANPAANALIPALGNPAQGLPFSILIDANGDVRHIRLGALRPPELKKWLLLAANHSVTNGANIGGIMDKLPRNAANSAP